MLFRYELRRFRGLLPVLALVFVMLVPTIYGAVYLAANWDPYGRLSSLPVAIVNEDRPVEYEGETLDTGADITRSLVEQNTFDWRETSREDAESGLREGRYYLVMEIPDDLSADLVSATGEDPQQAGITLRRNDANGFVIGSVTNSAQSKIESAVDQAAVEAYFRAVFENLGTIHQGMADAADGAGRLADGADQARDGAGRLADGAAQAHDGSVRLADGAAQARDGSQQLADGAGRLSDGAAQLQAGTAEAEDGAGRLGAGLSEARDGSRQLADGAGQLGEAAPALRGGAQELSAGLGRLETGSADLSDGAHQVADGTQELHDTVVPRLDTVIERQDRVAADVAAVNEDVQALNAAVGEGAADVTGGIDDASASLAALAEEDPDLAQSPEYAAVQEALTRARDRAGAAAGTAEEVAADSAAADARVQGFVQDDVAREARTKLTQLNDGAHAVAAGADELGAGIGQARTGADDLADGAGRFADGLERLDTGATALDDGLAQLQDGAAQLETGIGRLDEGAGELSAGADELRDGADELHGGLAELADGAGSLESGLGELAQRAPELASGTADLRDGAAELRDRLRSGADSVPALSEDAAENAALVMSRPVEVGMDVLYPAEKYGRGMAPMFFSIALWVLGIAAFNVMRPVSGRLLAGRRHPLLLAVAAWLPVGVVAVVGSLVMLGAASLLGLQPVHPWLTVLLTVTVAAVFSVIAHLLHTALGTPASAILLVVLILQLASTGGTYPAAVLPPFFQAISPVMPMTYSIEAFRYGISGGLPGQFWGGLAVLVGIGVTALLLDMACVRGRQRFRMKDLHPALEK